MGQDIESRPRVDRAAVEPPSPGLLGRGKVRIQDVAQRAQVSPATVSRVVTGSATVRPEVRARVLQAISDLGYRPNQVARNLRRQMAEMVGVIIADVENPFFSEMVRTVEDAAYRLAYRVLLCNTDENPEKQRSYLRVLAAERVLGVILAPSDPEAEEVGELLDLGIPVVAFDRQVRDARADSVTADNFNAGRQAARHLLDEGYERIAFVSSSGVQTVRDRQLGYEEVMRSAGLAPRSVPGLPRIEGGMATTQRLLEDPNPPDALIAANGLMALGALKTLRAHHVSIPQDVALVAFDDSVWSNLVDPPLTVLAQPVKRMAETAVEFLAERLAGGREEPRHAIFDLELRIRSSSAPTR